jgi:hypothetical protein
MLAMLAIELMLAYGYVAFTIRPGTSLRYAMSPVPCLFALCVFEPCSSSIGSPRYLST